MMEAGISIKPFGFDRVFRFGSVPDDEAEAPLPADDALHERIATLEARIEQMRREQGETIEAARAEGVAQGLEQARGERAEAMLAATDALHAALDDLGTQIAEESDRIMREAADVALCAADLIAGHAVAREPGRAVDEALGRALRQVVRGTALQIRVHPDSLADIERLVMVRAERDKRSLPVTFIEDANVAPQDAHISWAEGGLIADAAARRADIARELRGLITPEPQA